MPRPARAFTRAWFAGGLIATLLFAWMLTEGASAFLTRQNQSGFYDEQARSLLDLRWDMPRELLNLEAFIVNGKAYMYFGPVPALLRLPIVAVTHRFDGRLTQPSMLAAFVVSLVTLRRLAWRARWLTLGDRAVGRREAWATGGLCALLGAGSVLLFLASRAWVYHEAILWGIAFSLAAYDRLSAYIVRPRRRDLAIASAFASLAVLSRGSVGAGPVAALVALFVVALWSRARVRVLLVLATTALLPIALYAYVNVAKFGTLYSVPVDKQLETAVSEERREVLRANDGALFGPQFIPSTVLQYVRPDAVGFDALLPWIAFPGHRAIVIGDVTFDNLDRASSIPASMPALTLFAAIGVAAVFLRSRCAAFRIPIIGAAAGTILLFTIAYIAQRYLGDVFPLLALGAVAALPALVRTSAGWSQRRRRVSAVIVLALAVFSIGVNAALAYSYQRAYSGRDDLIAPFVRFQREIDGRLLGGDAGGITRGATRGALGRPADDGTMRVLGDCDGTYWSDGQRWWAVERTNRTGYFHLRLRFAPRRAGTIEPVATSGPANTRSVLAVEHMGSNRVRFRYWSSRIAATNPEGQWFDGAPVAVDRNREHDLVLILDYRIQQARLVLDGDNVLEPFYLIAPDDDVELGRAQSGDPVAAQFSGSLRNLAVAPTFCRRLERRGQLS
jgi:hypothetical protein